jgi:hypothetical protein
MTLGWSITEGWNLVFKNFEFCPMSCRKVSPFYWLEKTNIEICIEFTFHSAPLTLLLLAPTLSVGEYNVSGGEGELKVSQWRGLSRYGFLFSFSHKNAWDQSIDQVIHEAIIRLTLAKSRKLTLKRLR